MNKIVVKDSVTGNNNVYKRIAYTPALRRKMRSFLQWHYGSIYRFNSLGCNAYGFFANKSDPDLLSGKWNWGGYTDMAVNSIGWQYLVCLSTNHLYMRETV